MKHLIALLILASAGLSAPSSAFGQGGGIIAQTAYAKAGIANATVRICTYAATPAVPCDASVAIYSDTNLTHQITNPTLSDAQGNVFVFAVAGLYTCQFSKAGYTTKSIPCNANAQNNSAIQLGSNNTWTGTNTYNGNTIFKSAPYSDIRAYGATCNASADDTPALTSWLTASSGKGVLYVPDGCYFKTTSTAFPTNNVNPTTIVLDGQLKVGATFVLPTSASLSCRTGAGNNSFVVGNTCQIVGDSGVDPVVQVMNGSILRDVNIKSNNGTALYVGGTNSNYGGVVPGAMIQLINVSATTTAGSQVPLVIDRLIWLWTSQLRAARSGGATSPEAIHITNPSITSQQVGILQFNDTVITGTGILIDSVATPNNFGNIRFVNIWRESGVGPMFKFDLTNFGFMEDVEMSHVEEADKVNVTPCSIQIVHPGTTGHAFGIHIIDSPSDDMVLCGDTQYAQVYHDGLGDSRGREFNFTGNRMWNYTARSSRWDADEIALDTDRRYLPLGSVVMNQAQDPASWLNGAWTTTTGPDGGAATGGKNSTGGATSIWSFGSNKLSSWAIGDWVCAGIWMKTDVNGTSFPSGTLYDFGLFNDTPSSGSPTVDGDWQQGSHFTSDKVGGAFYHDQWQERVGCGKVTALAANGATTYGANLQIYGSATNVVDYAKPWLIRIPAASITEGDVVRIRRNGLKAVAQDSVAGAINYFKGEQICIGGACLASPSTGILSTTGGLTVGTAAFSGNGAPSLIWGYCAGTATSSQATLGLSGLGFLIAADGNCTHVADDAGASMPMPTAGTIKNLRVKCGTAGTNASSGAFTVYKNGSSQTLTCTVGTSTVCSDTTHSFSVVAADRLVIAFSTQGSETLANCRATIEKY